jgi:hypothetical protein
MRPDVSPCEVLERLLAFDSELRLEAYYSERSVSTTRAASRRSG